MQGHVCADAEAGNDMTALGKWLTLIQRAIHTGSALWFLAVLLYVNPEWSEEWRDLRILLVLNSGAAALNILIYTAVYLTSPARRAK